MFPDPIAGAPPARRLRRSLQAAVRRHPLLAFLLVFNTLGQALAFVPVVARSAYGVELDTEVFLIAPTLLFLLLPALVITGVTRGRHGLRALLRRTFRFAVPARWYLLALLGVPLLVAAATASLPDGGLSAPVVASAYAAGYLPALLFQFLTTNWWEETVWMGFFQASLQRRYGPVRAVLLTTPFFALQHVSLAPTGSLPQALVWFAVLTVVIIPVRALLAWVYNRTGSTALVGLVHAASNAAAAGFVPRLYGGQIGQGALALAVLGLVVLLATRGRLGLPRQTAGEHASSATRHPHQTSSWTWFDRIRPPLSASAPRGRVSTGSHDHLRPAPASTDTERTSS